MSNKARTHKKFTKLWYTKNKKKKVLLVADTLAFLKCCYWKIQPCKKITLNVSATQTLFPALGQERGKNTRAARSIRQILRYLLCLTNSCANHLCFGNKALSHDKHTAHSIVLALAYLWTALNTEACCMCTCTKSILLCINIFHFKTNREFLLCFTNRNKVLFYCHCDYSPRFKCLTPDM